MKTLFVIEQEKELLEVLETVDEANEYVKTVQELDKSYNEIGYKCGDVHIHIIHMPTDEDSLYSNTYDYFDYDNTYLPNTRISYSDIIEFFNTEHYDWDPIYKSFNKDELK